jgi:hypothetical protein
MVCLAGARNHVRVYQPFRALHRSQGAAGPRRYWKAYRTSHGTLHRVYLGKAQDLTLDRLNRAAASLAVASAPPASPPAAPTAAMRRSRAALAQMVPSALPEGTLTFLFTDIVGSTTPHSGRWQSLSTWLANAALCPT